LYSCSEQPANNKKVTADDLQKVFINKIVEL
jgi:hypothetical protein